LAQALARAGRRDEALQEQTAIQSLNERNANIGRVLILLETANTSLSKGESSAAINDLREAITLTPDFAEPHYHLAIALLAGGHPGANAADSRGVKGDTASISAPSAVTSTSRAGERSDSTGSDPSARTPGAAGAASPNSRRSAMVVEAEAELRRAIALD